MGDTEHHPILTWWTHRSLGDPASASRLLMWVLSMRLELLGPFTVDSMKEKNTNQMRCARNKHHPFALGNILGPVGQIIMNYLSLSTYWLAFHGGSLLLIHPVLYRTSSGYGVPTQWCPNRKASHWAPHPARPLRGDVVQISDRLIQVLRWSRLLFLCTLWLFVT